MSGPNTSARFFYSFRNCKNLCFILKECYGADHILEAERARADSMQPGCVVRDVSSVLLAAGQGA